MSKEIDGETSAKRYQGMKEVAAVALQKELYYDPKTGQEGVQFLDYSALGLRVLPGCGGELAPQDARTNREACFLVILLAETILLRHVPGWVTTLNIPVRGVSGSLSDFGQCRQMMMAVWPTLCFIQPRFYTSSQKCPATRGRS